MSKKEKPLPTPPHKPFGTRKKFEGDEEHAELTADRIAQAAAEGKLDEFLKKEMPDNEYARNLASMMMGMTGMLPMAGAPSAAAPPVEKQAEPSGSAPAEQVSPAASAEVLEEARKAIEGNDVKSLMKLLQQEHRKRTPGSEAAVMTEEAAAPSPAQPAIDKDQVDALLQIARDNDVSVDWLILRAIKVYVEEYRKTGKL